MVVRLSLEEVSAAPLTASDMYYVNLVKLYSGLLGLRGARFTCDNESA
jgi:hypothetical protein